MEQTNWPAELRKRGFKLTPLPPLTPEQRKHIQKISNDVNKFLTMMEEAHKASEKSTLRFARSVTHHHGHPFFVQKIHQKTQE